MCSETGACTCAQCGSCAQCCGAGEVGSEERRRFVTVGGGAHVGQYPRAFNAGVLRKVPFPGLARLCTPAGAWGALVGGTSARTRVPRPTHDIVRAQEETGFSFETNILPKPPLVPHTRPVSARGRQERDGGGSSFSGGRAAAGAAGAAAGAAGAAAGAAAAGAAAAELASVQQLRAELASAERTASLREMAKQTKR